MPIIRSGNLDHLEWVLIFMAEQGQQPAYPKGGNTMIKVSVLYPYSEGVRFDMGYYCNSHMPLVQEKLGAACKGLSVEHGVSGPEPGTPPVYIAMGHLYFETVEAFQEAFGPHAEAIMGDVPNYTDIQPVLQISEVKL
jgi:uncharacterized protein (TIGR02118 family)